MSMITKHHFEYLNHKYFRGNAHLVEICTYGEKKDPIGDEAYIDPQNIVKREYLVGRVTKGMTASVNWSQTSQADVEVNGTVKVFGVGINAATSYSYSKVKSANVKLFNLYINEGPLQTMLNTDASGARKYMADEGSDARIVSEVWVVMEATLAEHFETSGSIAISVPMAGGLNVTAKGGTQGTQTITLSAGSVFAFKMHKVKEWNSDKTKILNMEADYKN